MTRDTCDLKLTVLSDISRIIAKAMDLENTLSHVLSILSETLSMKRATITLLDKDSDRLVISASHGLNSEERSRGVYRLDEGVTGKIFQTAKPFVVPDIRTEPTFLDRTGARSVAKGQITFLGVPIMHQSGPMGVLTVDRLFGEDVSCDEDVEFLQVVATLISQFISLNEQIQDLRRENASLRYKVSKSSSGLSMVGRSPAMMEVQRQMEKVAPTRATVLLLGESGTGKTLIGRIIHDLSDRRTKAFIKINCASIPENLLESELFGYEKGAFTGASSSRRGKFEEADEGTIFLDEIGELSLGLQAKLLRVLQEREFERIGGNRTRRVDVRILAATNRDLEDLSRTGKFRPDLYYRLNVFPIHTPPLRERGQDVETLLLHFLSKVSREYGRTLRFTPRALDILRSHTWPGNVREMENLVERLVILAEDEIIDVALIFPYIPVVAATAEPTSPPVMSGGAYPATGAGGASPGQAEHHSLQEMEKAEVMAALERHNWIQSRAAAELGITPRQMGYRIKKFDLEALVAENRARVRCGR